MKLCIVIQSDAFRTSAGMRIRYDRFRECIADPNVSFDALTCGEIVATRSLKHDVYIFCKTFDTTALLLARRIRAAGKVVGQDLFDDYFSQYDDPRLARFRDWLRDMAPVTQFAICSTPRMIEVVRPYMPDIRTVSIEDPIIGYDPLMVAARSDAKAARARGSKMIEIAWFGIGDNPYFPVGLMDLVACEPELARIERLGWKILLRIITNRRAIEGGAAELLRRLSVDYEIVEWTEQSELDALARATVAILPVNGQSFSRAKSMNRAVTALCGGCQVLSLGFPLYERLDDYIYRSVDELLNDLVNARCRVSAERIDGLTAQLATLANPFEAAASFVREARSAMEAASAQAFVPPLLCLIHGRKSTIGLHKLVSALKGLSVGTFFNKSVWNFHVRFDVVSNKLAMRAMMTLAERFELPLCNREATYRIGDFDFVEVDVIRLGIEPLALFIPDDMTPIEDLSLYDDVIQFALDSCRAAFAPADVLLSEASPLIRCPREPLVLPKEPIEAETVLDLSLSMIAEEAIDQPSSPTTEEVIDESQAMGATAPQLDEQPENLSQPSKRVRFGIGRKAYRRERALALFEASALFDPHWYRETYPDVAVTGSDPAGHYFEFGWREGRDPGPNFSSKLYLKANRDVVRRRINPLVHYLENGAAEGRRIANSLNRDRVSPGGIVE